MRRLCNYWTVYKDPGWLLPRILNLSNLLETLLNIRDSDLLCHPSVLVTFCQSLPRGYEQKAAALISICYTKNAELKKNEESLILPGNVIDYIVSRYES